MDFARGAKDHASHAGVIVRVDCFVDIELQQAHGEIETFFKVVEIHPVFVQLFADLGHSRCYDGIIEIQIAGECGDFFR